ncbi:Do family serine endopeptidase [Parvibaculum sp.]|uniref:Do family serine endopeptidase n=1 Tax=Parvibaculum sp. TaxID=2024848 RepID=UPI0025DF8D87|nr:Do family serine endopeptidase [Parvibaculum sp.]
MSGGLLFLAAVFFLSMQAGPAEARAAPASVADLVQSLSPAVVNISTTQTIHEGDEPEADSPDENTPDEGAPDGDQPDGEQPFPTPDGQDGPLEKVQSLGSGFVIDAKGIIVTNNHVIDGADKIDVTFTDGTTLPAKLLGRDDKTDIAVLKVETKMALPFVKLGDSDKMRVGDWVMAIGNPFGLGGTVTVGIVSALNRDIHAGNYDDFIQTDSSINRGNSGGPLFNLDGKVIGMNTEIISPSGESVGIGFATPSSTITAIVQQIVAHGEIRRGWIGVRIQMVTPEIAQTLGLAETHGALIAGVTPGGPAEAAHMETGDLVVGFDGQKVREMRDLPRIVAETEIGKTTTIDVIRGGDRKSLRIKVAQLKEPGLIVGKQPVKTAPPKLEKTKALGLDLVALSDELRERYKLDKSAAGVLVSDVSPDSAAADKGIRPGDLIVRVGQSDVKTPKEIVARIAEEKKAGRTSVLLRVVTGSDTRFVAVPMD